MASRRLPPEQELALLAEIELRRRLSIKAIAFRHGVPKRYIKYLIEKYDAKKAEERNPAFFAVPRS